MNCNSKKIKIFFVIITFIFINLAPLLFALATHFFHHYYKSIEEEKILRERSLSYAMPNVLVARAAGLVWEWFYAPAPPPLDTVTADNFNFENYGVEKAWQSRVNPFTYQGKALSDALNKLLPLGTSKTDVEQLLVTKAGAKIIKPRVTDTIIYNHRMGFFPLNTMCSLSWDIITTYNTNFDLVSLKVSDWGCPSKL